MDFNSIIGEQQLHPVAIKLNGAIEIHVVLLKLKHVFLRHGKYIFITYLFLRIIQKQHHLLLNNRFISNLSHQLYARLRQ